MSQLSSQVRTSPSSGLRTRIPRFAETAVERARLTVVPARKVSAPRTPFAVLVLGLLAAGVVGLLMFNTHMQQASFRATALENKANALVAHQQSLAMELERLRDPQHLAARGRKLGLVAPAVPAFLKLEDGSIAGVPTAATPEDYVPIRSAPIAKPADLDPRPIVITVKPKPATTTGTSANSTAAAGSGSTNQAGAAGTNEGAATTSTGATR